MRADLLREKTGAIGALDMSRHACMQLLLLVLRACMHGWTDMHGPACMNRHACCCCSSSCCCCLHVCVRGYLRDRHLVSADVQLGANPSRRGESNFRIEIFAKVRNGQKGEFGATGCPELALLTVPNFRKYFYTKIRFSTPALSALLPLAGQICLT